MKNEVSSLWEFEDIMSHVLDLILIVDENQMVRYVTPSFTHMTGYELEDIIGRNAFEIVHPDDKVELMASHSQTISTNNPVTDEYRIIDKSGSIRYFESRVMPISDQSKLAVVAIRDISDRKKVQIELHDRKERYKLLQNSLKQFSQDLSSVMKRTDLEDRLTREIQTIIPFSNPHILVFNTQEEEKEQNLQWQSHLSKLSVGKLVKFSEKLLLKMGERANLSYILVLNGPSELESMEEIWLETLVYYASMVFESLNVIENLMNQLDSAIKKNETPTWVLRLLFNLSEKERLNLSADLHDTVLQDQINLYRKLASLMERYEMNPEVSSQLKTIEQGLLDTIHQIRMTCNELRPPLLRELGLERALENLFEYTQVSSTFKIHFSTENTLGLFLDEEQTIGIYRIVQELINNASKHSNASNVYINIHLTENLIEFSYSDDGIGLDMNTVTPSFNTLGLTSIRQRAESLMGTVEFDSKPKKGLNVLITIPFDNKEKIDK